MNPCQLLRRFKILLTFSIKFNSIEVVINFKMLSDEFIESSSIWAVAFLSMSHFGPSLILVSSQHHLYRREFWIGIFGLVWRPRIESVYADKLGCLR